MNAYRELLRGPQVRGLVLAVFVSGVGGAALPLALVLMVRAQTIRHAYASRVGRVRFSRIARASRR